MTKNRAMNDLVFLKQKLYNGIFQDRIGCIDYAIKALEEVQEYRKLGTLEELARAREYIDLAKKHGTIGEMIDECAEYESIGTMEECREAVEKQRPKKSKDILKINPVIDGNGAYVDADTTVYLLCPNCEELVGIEENCDNYCRECGQKIDKESEEE